MRTRLLFLVFLALVILGYGSEKKAEPGAYAIKLYRPQAKGVSQHVRVTGNFEEIIEPVPEDATARRKTISFTYDIDAMSTVLADDLKAEGPVSQLTIIKATKTTGESTTDLFTPGAVVIEKRITDKTEFFVGDAVVDNNTASILRIAGVSVGVDPGVEDLIHGTKDLKCVGDSWPINAEVAAAHYSKLKILCRPENISGSMRLKEVVNSGGEQLLALEEETALQHCTMPLNFPEGFSVLSSDGYHKELALYPVDLAKPSRSGSAVMEIIWMVQKETAGKTVAMKVTRTGAVKKEVLSE